MLQQYIEQMWFYSARQKEQPTAEETKIFRAEETALDTIDDFKFCLNIAVDRNNVERNPVNAANIWKYFDKEIVPSWKKLDERLQLACLLDWYAVLYRAMEEISRIPKALRDRQSVQFVRVMGLEHRWKEAQSRYETLEQQTPAPQQLTSFDAWLSDVEKNLIHPQNELWRRQEKQKAVETIIRRVIQTAVTAVVLYVAISYFSGYGAVARYFHHEKIRTYATQTQAEAHIEGFNQLPPLDIKDYNASSIRTDESGFTYSDRFLRDGDPSTAWEEGEPDDGVNRRLFFNIKGSADVHYIVIWNGNQKDEESYRACNRLRYVTVRINDRMHSYRVTLKDQEGPQYIRVERQDVDKLWIIIDSVYRGTDPGNNTAVSEVEIY